MGCSFMEALSPGCPVGQRDGEQGIWANPPQCSMVHGAQLPKIPLYTCMSAWRGLGLGWRCCRVCRQPGRMLWAPRPAQGGELQVARLDAGSGCPAVSDLSLHSCWLSLEGGLLYAFVGPAAAVVLVLSPPPAPGPHRAVRWDGGRCEAEMGSHSSP